MAGRFGLGKHVVRKGIGDAMGVDRDQADRFRIVAVAEDLAHAGARDAVALAGNGLGKDQMAVLGVLQVLDRDLEFDAELLVDRDQAGQPCAGGAAQQAENAFGALADAADHAGLEGVGFVGGAFDAGQHAVADAGRRFVDGFAAAAALDLGRDDDQRRRRFAGP